MSNGRNKAGKGDSGRDSGGFVALPWTVLDCPAYAGLSHAARALLMEVARQFVRDDNGRMLLSREYLKKRGWYSAGVIQKAKQELLDARFIFQTVLGHRPNKASWYAVTWRRLDKLPGYDFGVEQMFERGAYRSAPGKEKRPPLACRNPKKNGASLSPPHGTERPAIVPPHGTENPLPVPPHGAIRAVFGALSVPPHGHPLEMPSTGVGSPAVLTTGPAIQVERAARRKTAVAI